MAKDTKQQKKVSFSEQDAATVLQKFDANTVLTLLQELANYPHWKFDWNELVAKTSTGISDAAEYQRLWRHLAYGHTLTPIFEENAQPLDDDSDLECEPEALPPVNKESKAAAATCVQVMTASLKLSESTPTSSVISAPLTINLPVCDSSGIPKDSSQPFNLMMQEKNIIFPVTVRRQSLPNVPSTRAMKTNESVSGNTSIKKKRAAWSEEEDKQLRDAVRICGEGNWTEIATRDDFPIKKSTSQLSKRWRTLQKKDGGSH